MPVTSEDLKKWRTVNSYAQVMLAQALNVIPVTVNRWERGAKKYRHFCVLPLVHWNA
jgi:predicted transcriptional regulator